MVLLPARQFNQLAETENMLLFLHL